MKKTKASPRSVQCVIFFGTFSAVEQLCPRQEEQNCITFSLKLFRNNPALKRERKCTDDGWKAAFVDAGLVWPQAANSLMGNKKLQTKVRNASHLRVMKASVSIRDNRAMSFEAIDEIFKIYKNRIFILMFHLSKHLRLPKKTDNEGALGYEE